MRSYLKQITWMAVLAAATAFAQTPPEAPQAPATPPAEAPETPMPKVRVRPPKPPKPPKAHAYAYSFSDGEGGSYLGVGVRDVSHDTMAQLKLNDERGVEVTSIDSEGPAAKAGVKEHDVILTFNGQDVEGYEQLRRMIRETPSGRKVKLGLSRDGKPLTAEVTLGKHEDWSVVRPNVVIPPINIPPMNFDIDMPGFTMLQMSSRSGLTVEDLTSQLGEFFGAKGGQGVLVRNVERGSSAENAGLKAGDVIVKIGSSRVSNSNDWRRLMRQQRTGTVPITILRDRREQTLSMKISERRGSDTAFEVEFPDVVAYNSAELEKVMKQLGPALQRSSEQAMRNAQRSVEQSERELQRQIERSMRELERELEKQQKELSKDDDKE